MNPDPNGDLHQQEIEDTQLSPPYLANRFGRGINRGCLVSLLKTALCLCLSRGFDLGRGPDSVDARASVDRVVLEAPAADMQVLALGLEATLGLIVELVADQLSVGAP